MRPHYVNDLEIAKKRLLELSGLQKGKEYSTQYSVTTEGGQRVQPDLVLHLPEGKSIVLQIAASAALTNLRPAQRLMKELKPLGCQLSVSQFNGERRTLQLLEHLDASFVKLDKVLTQDSHPSQVIVKLAGPSGHVPGVTNK